LEYLEVCFSLVLSLRLETKKHCLKGDKLGKVIICIAYQFTLKNRSFLQNFTRLHLVTRTFYFRQEVRKYHANPPDDWIGIVTIPQAEYDDLMVILAKASLDDIWHLQNALTELSQIDYRFFE
jgi:hypothetical protein